MEKSSWKLTDEDKKKIVDSWMKGMSTKKISKIYLVNDESIRHLIKRRLPKNVYRKISKNHMKRFFETKRPTTKINTPRLNSDLSWWIGVVKGDGYVNHKWKYVKLEVTDKDFRDRWARVGISLFDMEPKISYNKNKGSYIAKFNSKLLVKFLDGFGRFGRYCWDVPTPILKSGFAIKSAFLRGLFDAEGSVKGSPRQHEISFISVNKKAASSVKKILGELGVNSRIKSESRKNGRVYQVIRIYGFENLRKFNFSVKFTINRKSEKLNGYLMRMYERKGLI